MRNHGPEDRQAAEGGRIDASVSVRSSDREPGPSDLVFDFSDLDQMRVQDLSVMLTARQMAFADDRTVWAAGVPVHTWRTLHAMGLRGFFKPFPTSDVQEV